MPLSTLVFRPCTRNVVKKRLHSPVIGSRVPHWLRAPLILLLIANLKKSTLLRGGGRGEGGGGAGKFWYLKKKKKSVGLPCVLIKKKNSWPPTFRWLTLLLLRHQWYVSCRRNLRKFRLLMQNVWIYISRYWMYASWIKVMRTINVRFSSARPPLQMIS